MENKILVLYIGVQGIRSEDIEDFTKKVSKKIMPSTFEGEIIVIPTHSQDTRIECINPTYITDDELIKRNNQLIHDINFELHHQLELLKIENGKIINKLNNDNNNEKESRN